MNWWSLLKCGFEPHEYFDPHEDLSWRLSGHPWRVLHKGSLRIPVFRKRRGDRGLHQQHLARMAAYCHLIETAEGHAAPYGIILFGSDYDGVTVPNTEANRHVLRTGLLEARQVIESNQPAAPPSSWCQRCPNGWPKVYRRRKTDTRLGGQEWPPVLTRGVDGRKYHSACGDRFGDVPRHERAKEKGLC